MEVFDRVCYDQLFDALVKKKGVHVEDLRLLFFQYRKALERRVFSRLGRCTGLTSLPENLSIGGYLVSLLLTKLMHFNMCYVIKHSDVCLCS